MKTLFTVEGDVFDADSIAAVLVYPPDDECGIDRWNVTVVLFGGCDPINYYEDEEDKARKLQLEIVSKWKGTK